MRIFSGIAVLALLPGCMLDDLGLGNSPDAVFQAATVDEIIDLGGARMSDDEISATFSGTTLIEPNEAWSWAINADGTHAASADDGTWADAPGGTWQVVDGKFCRENEDLPLKCSDVYRIGSYYRFTEADGSLAVWTVTQG